MICPECGKESVFQGGDEYYYCSECGWSTKPMVLIFKPKKKEPSDE